MARLYTLPVLFAPGKDVAYGNTGMMALSALLEHLSASSYEAALHSLVLSPARLDHTQYDDPARLVAHRARGYLVKDGRAQNAEYMNMTWPSGAGGLLSTVDDLDRFTQAFVGRQMLPPALTEEALTAKNSDYGYGWAVRERAGKREISHIGDINGFGSFLAFYPAEDVVVVVLSNVQRTHVRDFADVLVSSCGGRSPSAPGAH